MASIPNKSVHGVVDRISGSGNAMLQIGSEEKNLGSLPESVVGEEITALTLGGVWAICLDPEYLEKEYISSLLEKGAASNCFGDSEIEDFGSEKPRAIFVKLLEKSDFRFSPPQDINIGDRIKVNLLGSVSQDRWLANYQNHIVYVDTPFAAVGLTLNVCINDIDDKHLTAEINPATEPQKMVSVGEEIEIKPKAHDSMDTYAVLDDIPVYIPEEYYPTGEEIIVGVETVSNIHIAASFNAIDREHLPKDGTIVSLDSTPETGISIIDGLPYDIEPPLFSTDSSSDICVTGVTSEVIKAVYNISNTISVDSGDKITFEIEKVDDGQVIGRYENMPVVFSHKRRLSSAVRGETVSVQIEEILADRLRSSLTAPSSSTVEIGAEYRMTVLGRSSDYAVAIVDQTPIVVESSYLLQEGDELRVQLTEVHQGCIEGSVSALPDCPSEGDAIRVSPPKSSAYTLFNGIPITVPNDLSINTEICLGVEAVNSDSVLATVHGLPLSDPPNVGENIVASIVQDSSFGTFAVSDSLPVLLPIRGISENSEVVVTVVDVKAAYIQAFISSVESDEGFIDFSEYHEHIQYGITDIQQETFADAAVHFNAAAEIGAKVSSNAATVPKYVGALSIVINSIQKGDIDIAETAVEDAIEMLPEGVEEEKMRIPVEICRLRLQATGLLLEAIQGVSGGYNSNSLQHIYQESVARSPLREATQVLQEGREIVQKTQYEEMVPGMLLQRVLWLADREFSSVIDDLAGWMPESSSGMENFTWLYQFLENYPELVSDTNPDSEVDEKQAELFSLDLDGGIGHGESVTTDPVQLESDPEPVDANDGTATETAKADDGSSEVTMDTVQSLEADGDSSVTAPTETVEKSPTASGSNISSPKTEESAAAEDSPLEVVTEVEGGEVDFDLSELRAEAEEKASSNPVRDTALETTIGSRYQRSPAIRDYALARADGVCECCGDPAPFRKPGGEPYLEVHHVDELGEGGEDHPDKVVAVCPVCHKRIHHGEDGWLINSQLEEKLKEGLADAGTE